MSNGGHELISWATMSCRTNLKNVDYKFIKYILKGEGYGDHDWDELKQYSEARDELLDHDAIIKAILEHPGNLPISLEFYFYTLIRRALREIGLENRELADYLVAVLINRVHSNDAFNNDVQGGKTFFYIIDALQQIAVQSSQEDEFFKRVQLGNQTLFITGLFEDHLKARTQRKGAPDIEYYQAIGEVQFIEAYKSPLSEEFRLKEIFETLGESFGEVRLALSKFSDRFICLGDSPM